MVRFIFGKYAYREFIGLIDAVNEERYGTFDDYGCEEVSYHQDDIPKIKWWTRRLPEK